MCEQLLDESVSPVCSLQSDRLKPEQLGAAHTSIMKLTACLDS